MIRSISLYDLMSTREGEDIVRNGSEEDFANLLWQLGFDLDKGVERMECFHRPLTMKGNDPIYGLRFVGNERTDKEWKESGNWSDEARMQHYREHDPEMYKDLMSMSYLPNFTGDILKHIKGEQVMKRNNNVESDLEGND